MTEQGVVLYAEDDENDLFLMERAFEKTGITHPLRNVADGKQALAYLGGTPPYSDREEHPLPVLLVMDLSMPGKHGLEVLRWVREQATLVKLPVVVLSSSNQETDIRRAYELGANGYFVKPGEPAELLRIVSALKDHWLSDKPAKNRIDVPAFRGPISDTTDPKKIE